MLIRMDARTTPNTLDILCGRGKTYHNHRGNQRFRALIAVHIPKYADVNTTRKQKTGIVQSIVDELYGEGCRFLKQDTKSSLWFDVGFHKAKQKVGHALRDATAEMHRSLKRANRHHSSSSSSSLSSEKTNPPLPLVSRSMFDDEDKKLPVVVKPSPTISKNLKADDESSGSDSDSGLFPASEYIKYSDIEPISIASLSLASPASGFLPRTTEKEPALPETASNPQAIDDAFFFSSVLDMLNEASSVMGKEDR